VAWEQMLSIVAEAVAYVEDERTSPPLACPFDGEPLDAAPDGNGLFCKLGNYRWPQMRRLI
jgi:hypothetical protein